MILTLMGMSGAGKSFLSGQFAAQGWTVFDCDALIAAKLQPITGHTSQSLAEVGRWMGLPYEADFPQHEALYRACEAEVLREVVAQANACAASQTPCVIDTSGSVIYTDPALLQQLRQCSAVLYLRIPASLHQAMLDAYLEHPRPVVWDGLFQQAPDESLQDAFRRCYVQLIHHRERLYETYSDIVLEYQDYRQPTLTVERFLQHIRAAAERAGVADRLNWGDVGARME